MTEGVPLRTRLLLWHKILAQMTGTLSLSYGGKGLNRAVLTDWIERLRAAADDMQSIRDGGPTVLDEKGQRVLKSAGATAMIEQQRALQEKSDEVTNNRPGGLKHAGPKVATRRVK